MIIITSAKKKPTASVAAVNISYEIYILWLLILFLFGYILRSPQLAVSSVKKALSICGGGLIPSLFPFIVLTSMTSDSGLSDSISYLLGRPISRILGISKRSTYAVIIGALAGFPMGAICTRELYSSGAIDKSEAERLISFTNNASPAFCIGTIGIVLFSDAAFGMRLYFCQLTASLIIGFIQRQKSCSCKPRAVPREQKSIPDILTSAVSNGAITMLKICSFAVFFAVVGDAACLVTDQFFGEHITAIFASVCELTLGAARCSTLCKRASRIICAFAVGWSGLSVHMQSAAVLSGTGLSMRRYYVCKLCQGVLCALFGAVLDYFVYS